MGLASLAFDYLLLSVIRVCQFALGIAVCGLYGTDLNAARIAGKYQDGKWVYAVVIGALSAVSALIYLVPFMMRVPFAFAWDCLLFFMWVVVFGIFGNMYIKENAEGDSGVMRMKNAVWVDLTNMLLWLITAVVMLGIWWKNRNVRTKFTGRARQNV